MKPGKLKLNVVIPRDLDRRIRAWKPVEWKLEAVYTLVMARGIALLEDEKKTSGKSPE